MKATVLSACLISAAILAGAAAAQTVVRGPPPRAPVTAIDPVPVASLQSDLLQLATRVAALEAANAQLADRVATLNAQVNGLEQAYDQHRHSFSDNSVAWESVTVAGQQTSRITGEIAAHDLTAPPP